MAKRTKKNKNPIQWYITTCSNGNEDTVIKNLKAKVLAMHFEEMIFDAKVIKIRTIEEEIFDDNDPNKIPPKNMRNSATVKWKTLGNGKYLKTKIIDRNKFPGYIYVKMIMNDDAWYAVRNAQNITGLVGSSGKGAKPIPITFEEEMLLSGESENPEVRVVVLPNAIIEMDRTKFNDKGDPIGFEDLETNKQDLNEENNDFDALDKESKVKNHKKESKTEILDEKNKDELSEPELQDGNNLNEGSEIENAEIVKLQEQTSSSDTHENVDNVETKIDSNLNERIEYAETNKIIEHQDVSADDKEDLNSVNDENQQEQIETKNNDEVPVNEELEKDSNKYNLSEALENINDVSKLLPESDFSENHSVNSSNDELNFTTKEDPYKIGHFVEIILGEHSGIQGNIVEINRETNQVSVQVEIMGKETVLVLNYDQITLKK